MDSVLSGKSPVPYSTRVIRHSWKSVTHGKRIHRTVWRLLEGAGIDQHRWLERLPFVVYHLRTAPVMTKDGYSPVEIENKRGEDDSDDETPPSMYN